MKKCKNCNYKFVRFYDGLTKAWFKCSVCGKTTQGYTNSFGNFLGKVKGSKQRITNNTSVEPSDKRALEINYTGGK